MSKIKRQLYMILDTETCINSHAFEIACLIGYYDKNFKFVELHRMNSIILENSKTELFFNREVKANYFSNKNLKKRHEFYEKALNDGSIKINTAQAINDYFIKVFNKYPDLIVTAYNIKFDIGVLAKDNITFSQFKTLDLWSLSSIFYSRKGYQVQAMRSKWYTTKHVMKTDCETVLKYLGYESKHVHKALSDCYDEAFILGAFLRQKQKISNYTTAYNWKKYQLPTIFNRLYSAI